MSTFLPVAATHPCPLHGSASGVPAPELAPDEVRHLLGSNVWYRRASEDQRMNARKNSEVALALPRRSRH